MDDLVVWVQVESNRLRAFSAATQSQYVNRIRPLHPVSHSDIPVRPRQATGPGVIPRKLTVGHRKLIKHGNGKDEP